uniref:Secreted protein n=1 Tax=Anopheles atroparvus TaxID=41427 RepID=A0AAG5CWN1_ANOAO
MTHTYSVRSLATALICAVLINVICTAPVSEDNEIDSLLRPNTEASLLGSTEGRKDTEASLINSPEGRQSTEDLPIGNAESLPSYIPDDTLRSTTEDLNKVLGRIYSPISDKPGRIQFSGGVHSFRIKDGEDENKRLLEEYNYHFVRVEQNLPHTTLRQDRFRPPSKY